jgi:putative flippase GtrA
MSTTASAGTASSRTAQRSGGVLGRMTRCLSVSVLTTLLSLVTLAVLIGWWGMTSWVANVLATAVGTVPSYVLNRRWVWGRHGSGDVWREVVPFWALSFSGLVLSTAAVATADAWASSLGLVGPTRTAVLLLANVGSFAVLWVGQFLMLDRVLFGPTRRGSGHRRLDRLPVAGGEVGLEGVVDRPPVVHGLRPAELEQPGELLPAAHQVP